jgi:hypothetical protein
MKIAAVCCTYLRPKQLGRILWCFQRQDYLDRELLILDDAGQYDHQQGDRWRLVSIQPRYRTLGEKRNAAAALVGDDVDALAVWDDDDGYLPWALSSSVAALERAPWSRPSVVLLPQADGSLRQHATGGLFHGGWAYRRAAFRLAGGYPAIDNGEDQAFARRMEAAGIAEIDPIALGCRPFYVYPWGRQRPWHVGHAPGHLSAMGAGGYRRLGGMRTRKVALKPVRPPVDLENPRILPGVLPRPF